MPFQGIYAVGVQHQGAGQLLRQLPGDPGSVLCPAQAGTYEDGVGLSHMLLRPAQGLS